MRRIFYLSVFRKLVQNEGPLLFLLRRCLLRRCHRFLLNFFKMRIKLGFIEKHSHLPDDFFGCCLVF